MNGTSKTTHTDARTSPRGVKSSAEPPRKPAKLSHFRRPWFIILAAVVPQSSLGWAIPTSTMALLAVLGGLAAAVGAASIWRGAIRVMLWGGLAMLISAAVGRLFGTIV